jgi:hypothetical protein
MIGTPRTKEEQIKRLQEGNVHLTPEALTKYLNAPDVIKWDTSKQGNLPAGYRFCSKCLQVKKYYLFNRDKRRECNCTVTCKECQKEVVKLSNKKVIEETGVSRYKKYYHKNKERLKLAHRKYYEKNKEKILQHHKEYASSKQGKRIEKKAHKKRKLNMIKNAGIPYTRELVIQRDTEAGEGTLYCYICGKPILKGETIHLDHLIPVVKGGLDCFTNIVCVHEICNLSKSKDGLSVSAAMINNLHDMSEIFIDEHLKEFEKLKK